MRRFHISFERLGKVHWVRINSEDTAQFVFDALKIGGNNHVEVIDASVSNHPETPEWAKETL